MTVVPLVSGRVGDKLTTACVHTSGSPGIDARCVRTREDASRSSHLTTCNEHA